MPDNPAPPSYDQAVKFEVNDEKSPLHEQGAQGGPAGPGQGGPASPWDGVSVGPGQGGPSGQPSAPPNVNFAGQGGPSGQPTAPPNVNFAAAQKAMFKRAISLPSAEEQEERALTFNDKSIRRGFIRKVYAILMVQLGITVGAICFFSFLPDGPGFVRDQQWLLWTCMGLSFVFLFPMVCVSTLRRSFPINFIILFLFTVCEAVMVGMVTSLYKAPSVLIAVALTAGITLVLTIFAMQTKYDFTAWGGALSSFLFILIAFGFIMIFIPHDQKSILNLVYGCCGALLFSLYLIYDTQMMLGGSHKYSISPEEYVFAALALYLDVLNIFLYILRIIGEAKKN